MHIVNMDRDTIDPTFADGLLSVCRTTVGDELRSLSYFTDETVDQVYLRDDLERSADLVGFADQERRGFHAHTSYRQSQLGEYQATIRMFENGYLTRLIRDDHGVWVTTDSLSIDRFEELSSALGVYLTDEACASAET